MLHLVILGGGAIGSGVLFASKKIYEKYKNKNNNKNGVFATEEPARGTDQLVSLPVSAKQESERDDVHHHLRVSGVSFGIALAGHFLVRSLFIPAVSLVLYASIPVFRAAFRTLSEKKLTASIVDTIAILGALAATYYVVSAVTVFIYFVAQKLLLETEEKSKKNLSNIFGEQPRFVWLVKDGVEVELAFDQLIVGDTIAIHAGGLIPIDGIVVQGIASVDQHVMTGEAQPVEKRVGSSVLAGTMIVAGSVLVQVEKCGQDTVAAKIGEILQNTTDFRFSVEAKGTEFSNQLVLPTLALGGVGLLALGPISAVALVSCNFSEIIRVVSPIGVLNFLKLTTEQGILVKDGRSLELLNDVDTVVFDKTGTLTTEQPHVGKLHVWGALSEEELLQFAAAAEYKQMHPIAKAILQAAEDRGLSLPSIDNAKYDIGYGIKIELEQQTIHVGSGRFMAMENIVVPIEAEEFQSYCHENGHSFVYVAVDQLLVGAVELHVTIRPEAKDIIRKLRQRGLRLCIISGDHEKPTERLAKMLGIDDFFAETLPENKAQLIEQLQKEGRSVCFVGDGINDTIALKKSNVSISLQGASTAATDTAGIVLMDKNLVQLPRLFELASGLNRNMKNSFASALAPGAIGVVGVFLFHLGIYSTLLLYIASLATGTANAMLPLLTYGEKKRISKDPSKKEAP